MKDNLPVAVLQLNYFSQYIYLIEELQHKLKRNLTDREQNFIKWMAAEQCKSNRSIRANQRFIK
ncbi:hypothetical protein CIL05_00485 [Virgibacillus profundi]|uniref:Uncharacterized protein n=1 Tax=Virgibacillus profundi TaxID=2024555 RepID=A0A2A2II01_9BACI|nr:hypothetical protein CIL05_00485 [Virgibacillus profundi]